MRAAQVWLAVRLGAWLAVLPIRLHRQTLPEFLKRLTPRHTRAQRPSSQERDIAVRIVARLCRLRCFRGRLFPRLCIRQSLALYYVLARLGEPVVIHIGVSKMGDVLYGHNWATVDGEPLAERAPPEEAFRPIYTFACANTGVAGEGRCRGEAGSKRRNA